MRPARHWPVGVVALGLLAMLPALATRFFGRHRLRFTYATGTLAPDSYAALSARPGWSRTSSTVAPGVTLNGLLRRPSAPDAPWVLFFSGNDPTMLATGQRALDQLRAGRDWGAATYAYRGFDSSGGEPSPEAFCADAERIFEDLVRNEKVSPSRVHVLAFSLGAYPAAHLAGVAARRNQKVGSLSLLAGIEDIVMVHPSWAARLSPGDSYETQPLLDAIPAPVLVVQGSEDRAIGVEQGRRIAARLGDRARYVELQGIDHYVLLETEAALAPARELISSVAPRPSN